MRRRIALCLPILLAVGVAFGLRTASPETVERLYSRGVYPVLARILGVASDLVPFSLAELWGTLLILGALFLLTRGAVRIVRRRWSWRRAARTTSWAVLIGVPAVYLAFVGLWGANYARLPIEAKTGYAAARITPERFRAGLLDLARIASDARPASTSLAEESLASTADAVDEVVALLEGRAVPCARRPKTLVLNGLFRLTGVTGITIPFTHEAHHRRDLFPCEIPFIVAHERAHLAGYGSEAEASFVAWAACVRADDALVRYAGHLGLLREFLGAATPELRREAAEILSDGVRQDLSAIVRRRREEQSALHARMRDINDAYLRANRVTAGVRDYGRVVRLVLGADPSVWAP